MDFHRHSVELLDSGTAHLVLVGDPTRRRGSNRDARVLPTKPLAHAPVLPSAYVEVEYALRAKTNPIGVAAYALQSKLPGELKGRLPTVRQLTEAVRPILPTSAANWREGRSRPSLTR
jgi:hypothetical protein